MCICPGESLNFYGVLCTQGKDKGKCEEDDGRQFIHVVRILADKDRVLKVERILKRAEEAEEAEGQKGGKAEEANEERQKRLKGLKKLKRNHEQNTGYRPGKLNCHCFQTVVLMDS